MPTPGVEVGRNHVQLKHLGFVKILAINAVVLVWKLYGFAKQMSGPFKSTVGKVELVVTAVVRPIYYKFKEVPTDILVFLDNKVDEASYIFDKHAPPIAKNVVSKARSMVEKILDFMKEANMEGSIAGISQAGKISKEASSIFNELAMPIAKDAISEVKKASDLVKEAKLEGPIAGISHAGKNSKEYSNIFGGSGLSITKGVGSIFKKTSGKISKKASNISKEASNIFDGGALSITKGVGSMVKKASDLVQEGPIAAISYAGKISKETSHIFDEYAPSIAKNVVSTAGSMIKNASDLVQVARMEGPFAAISHIGKISKESIVMQLVTLANQYSFMYRVLEIVVPIAIHLLKKYNNLVKQLKGKEWCSLFSYVPLVPVEEIELAYKVVEEAAAATRKANELVEKAAAAARRFSKSGSNSD